MPTFPVDIRKSLHETIDPPLVPVSTSLPVARFGPKQLGCPVFFPHHLLSVSSPSAQEVESSCPMTSDSRFCRDCPSISFQNPGSIAHRPLLLLCLLSLAYTLPRPPFSKYKTALPHSSGSSHFSGWLIESGSLTQRLRSIPLSGTSSLLHVVPPLRLRIRTLALVVASTCGFSVSIGVSGSQVPLNRLFGKLRPPLMPDAAPPVNRFRRSYSRSNLPPAVLTSSLTFRHFSRGSLAVLFLPVT